MLTARTVPEIVKEVQIHLPVSCSGKVGTRLACENPHKAYGEVSLHEHSHPLLSTSQECGTYQASLPNSPKQTGVTPQTPTNVETSPASPSHGGLARG